MHSSSSLEVKKQQVGQNVTLACTYLLIMKNMCTAMHHNIKYVAGNDQIKTKKEVRFATCHRDNFM